MFKTILTAMLAVTLVFAFSTMSIAQAKPDMKAKQEEMKGMAKDKMKKMEEMGKSGLMSVSCDPACGFRVVSHDEAEITSMVKQHAKAQHQKEMTDAEVKGMMKPAGKMGMGDKMKEEMKEEMKDEKDPHKH